MKNKDVLAMEKAKIVEKMNQAIKDDDAKAFSEAFTELCQKIEDNVLEQGLHWRKTWKRRTQQQPPWTRAWEKKIQQPQRRCRH